MAVKNEKLVPLFDSVKRLLAPYAAGLVTRRDEPGYYDLWSEKEVEVAGRTRPEVFFAGLIIQKSYVGFYFMPVYTDDDLSAVFGAGLLSLKKGKSCFHIKALTPALTEQLEAALAAGYRLYEDRGWV
jgi:hypothetical protein